MDKERGHIDTIIGGCKRGDRKAQEQLYMFFYDAMMNLCVRFTKSETDAEDVFNTGFLKVFKSIHQYDPAKAALYTWVRAIMMNSCLYYLKSKQNRIAAIDLDEAEGISIDPEIDIKMSEAEIMDMIRDLPPATRAVFNLYTIDGYGHKEIASLLQISEGTSKWHLNAARKNLMSRIMQKENDI